MKRWAALAAVFAVVAAGVIVVVLTRTDHAAAQPSSLRDVVAQVQREFGDRRIVRAKIDGSSLHVILAPAKPTTSKGEFEASVLAAAVADWMRSSGRKPIERVRSFGGGSTGGRVGGELVPTAGLSISHDRCESAKASVPVGSGSAFARVSVAWLPYLHGTCVVRLLTPLDAPLSAVPAASLEAARKIWSATGNSTTGNPAARYFEVDDEYGRPLLWSYQVGNVSSVGSAPGITLPFAHG